MPNKANFPELAKQILNGTYDAHLHKFTGLVRDRLKHLDAINARSLTPGGHAKITGALRPQNLVGKTVEILEVRRTRALVRFLNPNEAGRFGSEPVTIPMGNLNPIN